MLFDLLHQTHQRDAFFSPSQSNQDHDIELYDEVFYLGDAISAIEGR